MLAAMNGKNELQRLHLDNDPICDQKINPISILDSQIIVAHSDRNLSASRHTVFRQLVSQAGFINILQ